MADTRTLLLHAERQVAINKAIEQSEEKVRDFNAMQQSREQRLLNRRYNYSGNPLTVNMPVGYKNGIAGAVEQGQISDNLSKKQKEAIEAERNALTLENEALQQRRSYDGKAEMTKQDMDAESKLLEGRIAAIKAGESAALSECKLIGDTAKKMEIRMKAAKDLAEAYGEYANVQVVGTELREKAMKKKEEADMKYHALKKELKVENIENKEEKNREQATIRRHWWYDVAKSVIKKDNPLSAKDAEYRVDAQSVPLINKERAFFGGTKPMYVFEDRSEWVGTDEKGNHLYKQYLYKEAINCLGAETPDRALVTEAASHLQEYLFGSDLTVKAFAAKTADGKVIGSFQEKVDVMKSDAAGAVDLFKWQAAPDMSLAPEVVSQVMREHTLDWLLCNFDTKGENFLQRASDGKLVSIDKEASFSKLKDPGAQHMSRTYKGNSNDTIYNTFFKMYVEQGMPINFAETEQYIQRMEQMRDTDYLHLFTPMLDQKYGKSSPDNEDRAKAVELIMKRKAQLRAEYKAFYGSLIQERIERKYQEDVAKAIQENRDPATVVREKNDRLDANGLYIFESERQQEMTEQATEQVQLAQQEVVQTQTQNAAGDDTQPQTELDKVMRVANSTRMRSRVYIASDESYKERASRGADIASLQSNEVLMEMRGSEEKRKEIEAQIEQRDAQAIGVVSDATSKNAGYADGVRPIVSAMTAALSKEAIDIKRKDALGIDRDRHIAKHAKEEELSSSAIKQAEEDFNNLFQNIKKDECLLNGGIAEIPEVMKERVMMTYMGSLYFKPIMEGKYGMDVSNEALSKEQREFASVRKDKLEFLFAMYKNTTLPTITRYVVAKAESEAASKAKLVLSKNTNPTAYERKMIELCDAKKKEADELLKNYVVTVAELAQKQDQFTELTSLLDHVNSTQFNEDYPEYVSIANRLYEIDKGHKVLGEEEKAERTQLVQRMLELVDKLPVCNAKDAMRYRLDNAAELITKIDAKIVGLEPDSPQVAELVRLKQEVAGVRDTMRTQREIRLRDGSLDSGQAAAKQFLIQEHNLTLLERRFASSGRG